MAFTNSEDRRTRRTKENLRSALTELLSQKDLAHISVREITDRADVNRSTFYLHYTDLQDLYQKTEDWVVGEITAIIEQGPDTESFFSILPMVQGVFDYVAENAALCTALLRTSGSALITRLVNTSRPRNEAQWKALMGSSTLPRDYFYAFLASGIVGLVQAWFEGGLRESPTYIAHLAEELAASVKRG